MRNGLFFLALFVLVAQPVWAQEGSISGTVVDAADGEPIQGAPNSPGR